MQQEIMGWQWQHLDCMQIISTSLRTDITAVQHHFLTDKMLFLTLNKQCQSTESNQCPWDLNLLHSTIQYF